MKGIVVAVIAAAGVAAATPPAMADGVRGHWRASRHYGAISHNVITPYYVGYYPGHYSYYKSAFIPPYLAAPDDSCSRWSYDGYRYWIC